MAISNSTLLPLIVTDRKKKTLVIALFHAQFESPILYRVPFSPCPHQPFTSS